MSKECVQTHLRAGVGLTEPGICQCAEDASESVRCFGKGSQAFVNLVYSFFSLCFRVDCWLWPRHGRDITTAEVLPYIQRRYYDDVQMVFDEGAEELRRLTLSKAEFRRSQVKQIELALDCIANTQEKAEVMQRWARSEALNGKDEGDICREVAARTLIELCLEYRAFALCVRARLQLWRIAMALLPCVCVPSIARLQTTTPYPAVNLSRGRRAK
ncbi:MAG TPA: hypothetical protein VFK06_17915 [Candidatus Angelobacter sp.]|nr:hypothetical protein [Candidatus Angelobacter sp.]